MNTICDIELHEAYCKAQDVRLALEGVCTHFALAGPLRRGQIQTDDQRRTLIDFVVVSEVFTYFDEEAGELVRKDLLIDAIEGLDDYGAAKLQSSFPYREDQVHILAYPWGLVRLWCATADTFGSVLLYRTGPRQHTDMLFCLARRTRRCWLPHAGLFDGLRVIGATEEEIYTALGLRFVIPEARVDEIG